MTRAAHQDIDDLAHTLGQRAEIEGLSKGVRIGARRQIVRWTIRWGIALAVAFAASLASGALRWLPVLVAALALLSLLSIFIARARANRRIATARETLEAPDGSLSELGRDPKEDRL